eukprot:12937751-Prorocentrum_lima.AAC.1
MCAGQRQCKPQLGIASVGLHSQQRCGTGLLVGSLLLSRLECVGEKRVPDPGKPAKVWYNYMKA